MVSLLLRMGLCLIVVLYTLPALSQESQRDSRAVYGTDNRRDEHQITSKVHLSLGDSTVVLVHKDDITDNSIADPSNRTFTLADDFFGDIRRAGQPQACQTEPFRDQPKPGFCSGFLVAPDIVVTAGHCIRPDPNCVDCDGVGQDDLFVVFGFTVPDGEEPDMARLTIPAQDVYTVRRVLGKRCSCNSDEDWAVLQLDRVVPDHVPLGIRRTGNIANNDNVFVIGHPAGLPRKYTGDAGGASVLVNTNTLFFETNLDTYGGNSGSAVFNRRTGEVEGILVRGDTDYCADTANACWFSCRYPQNPPSCNGTCEDVTRISLNQLLTQIPRVVFVNGRYSGNETGQRREPFTTIAEGVRSIQANTGVALVIAPGRYPEALTLRTPMRLYNGESRSGRVIIGQ